MVHCYYKYYTIKSITVEFENYLDGLFIICPLKNLYLDQVPNYFRITKKGQ